MALLLQNQEKQMPQQQNASKMKHPTLTMHSVTANNSNIITPEFIASIAQTVHNIQSSNMSKHKHSAPSNTDHPEYGVQMELCFDSDAMTPNEW